MAGVIVAWSFRCWAVSASPVRTAEPCRFIFNDDGGVGTTSSSRTRRSRVRRAGAVRTTAFLGFAARFLAGARFFVALARADRAAVLRRPAGLRDRFAALFFVRASFRLAMLMSFRNLDSVAISV